MGRIVCINCISCRTIMIKEVSKKQRFLVHTCNDCQDVNNSMVLEQLRPALEVEEGCPVRDKI